jgi:predicted ATPase
LLFRHVDDESAEQVNIWLDRLGYGRIEFDSLGNEYFQAQLVREDSKVNLADTGVGLSQVIPLLVQGTLAHRSSMIISQQPEIHLNPAQQSIVADFLIERAMNDVRILVETHSEHVLLRIRRRIAEGTLDASDVAIYYVEASNGGTRLRPVPVGDQGEIRRSDWPQGFFEDQLGEAFALAAAQSVGKPSHANN